MEQMTFKSLITRFGFDDIILDFKVLYRRLRADLFEQTDWGIYRNIYQELQACKVVSSNYAISVSER